MKRISLLILLVCMLFSLHTSSIYGEEDENLGLDLNSDEVKNENSESTLKGEYESLAFFSKDTIKKINEKEKEEKKTIKNTQKKILTDKKKETKEDYSKIEDYAFSTTTYQVKETKNVEEDNSVIYIVLMGSLFLVTTIVAMEYYRIKRKKNIENDNYYSK